MAVILTETTVSDHRAGFRVIRDEDRPAYDAGETRAAGGFTRVPELVRAMKDGYAVAVFEAIARHESNGIAWPSVAALCEETGWSKKIVLPAIERLVKAGAITKDKRFSNGMKQSNQYRITAYERMVPTEPTLVPTVTLDSSHGDSGWSPGNHKQEPIDQERKEQERTPPAPSPKPTKPLPENGPAQQIVAAYCRAAEIEKPANYGKSVKEAQQLADAGVSPGEIPALFAFTALTWKNGVDLRNMLLSVDRWRSSRATSRPPTANHAGEDREYLLRGLKPPWGSANGGIDHL